jgi:hypothetical protein
MLNVADYDVFSIIMYYKDIYTYLYIVNKHEYDVVVICDGESVSKSQMKVSCNGCNRFSMCITR